MNPSDRKGAPGALAVAALLTVLMMTSLAVRVERLTSEHPLFEESWDHHTYIEMSESPGAAHPRPFCYRLLVPTIARIVPLEAETSFYLLTLLFIAGAALVLFLALREIGENRFYAILGVCFFFSLNWGAKFHFFDFWLTDPALLFLTMLAIWFALRGSTLGVAIALTIGVLAKETALLVLPFYYGLRAARLFDPKALGLTLVAGLAPILVFLLVRILVPSSGSADVVSIFRDVGVARFTTGFGGFLRGGTVGTWGISLLLLPFFAGRERRHFAWASLLFLVFVYLQPLLAQNVDRLLVLGFPAVVILAVAGLRRLATRFDLSHWMTAGYAVVPFLVVLGKDGYQSPSPEKRLLALSLWTVVVVTTRLLRDRARNRRGIEKAS